MRFHEKFYGIKFYATWYGEDREVLWDDRGISFLSNSAGTVT